MTAVIAVCVLVGSSARNAAAVGLLPQGHSALDVSRSFRRSTYSSWPPTDSWIANHQSVIPVTPKGRSVDFRTSYQRSLSRPNQTLCFLPGTSSPQLPRASLPHQSVPDRWFHPRTFCCPPRPIPPNNLCLARTTCASSLLTAPRPDDFVAP